MKIDQILIAKEMLRIELIIMTYAPRDGRNTVVFCVLYIYPLARTLTNGPSSGFKKDNKRISILLCCKKDGKERMA